MLNNIENFKGRQASLILQYQAHFLIYYEYVKTTNNTRRDAHDK